MKNSVKDGKYKACCYLKKQIDKSDEEEQNKSGRDSEDGDAIYYDLPITFQIKEVPTFSIQAVLDARENSLRLVSFSTGIFRPPNVVG